MVQVAYNSCWIHLDLLLNVLFELVYQYTMCDECDLNLGL